MTPPKQHASREAHASLSLIDAVHHNSSTASEISYHLDDIANAMDRLGMRDLAEELCTIGERIKLAAKSISSAYGEHLSERLREGQENTGLLLSAVIAGTKIATPLSSSKKEDRR